MIRWLVSSDILESGQSRILRYPVHLEWDSGITRHFLLSDPMLNFSGGGTEPFFPPLFFDTKCFACEDPLPLPHAVLGLHLLFLSWQDVRLFMRRPVPARCSRSRRSRDVLYPFIAFHSSTAPEIMPDFSSPHPPPL